MNDVFNPIPNDVAYVDPFRDSTLDTNFWVAAVTGGVTTNENIGRYQINHEIAAAIGTGSISSLKKFGWHQTFSVGITLITGSIAGDGDSAEAGICLYKDATHFIKFGPYRHTGPATNNLSMLHYQNGGAENFILFSVTICDALLHQYSIIMLENHAVLLLDGVIVYDFMLVGFVDYIVQLYASVLEVADHLHVDFSNFICVKNTNFLAALFPGGDGAALLAQLLATDIVIDDIHGVVDDIHGVVDTIHTELEATDVIADDIKTQVLLMDTKHVFSSHVDLTNTTAVEVTFDAVTHGAQFELVLAAALGQGVMPKAIQDNGGALTDYTAQCNSLTTRDIMMFPAVPDDGDAFIVMATTKFCYIDVYMEGGIVNTDNVLAIQYYRDDHTWVAIPGVTDGTFDIQSLGKSGRVSFAPPADWDTGTFDGFFGYAVRFVITNDGVDVPYATHIQLSDNASESFDQVAHEFDTLLVYIKRNFPTIGYQNMVGDKMEYVQCLGVRDVDINGFRCYGDTKVGFQLGATPDKPVVVPYFGFTRRL